MPEDITTTDGAAVGQPTPQVEAAPAQPAPTPQSEQPAQSAMSEPTEAPVAVTSEAADPTPQAMAAPAAEGAPQPAEGAAAPAADFANEPTFQWHASEYVHHHKGTSWYIGLAVVVVALLGLAVAFKLWLSIGVFLAMGGAIFVYAKKPPRVLYYQLDGKGITIDEKAYPYENFRSFGVVSDEEWHQIDLEPTQRLMPRLSVLFADEDFDQIIAHLTAHLPRADRQPDTVERLSKYLRF